MIWSVTATVPEGFIDYSIEVVIEIPVPGFMAGRSLSRLFRSLPVSLDDLVCTATVPEGTVNNSIEIVIEIPVSC